MSLTLNSEVVPDPNEFGQDPSIIGRFNETLAGSIRRDIVGITETWFIGYKIISVDDYNALRTIYETPGTKLFEWTEESISEVEVHMDMNRRTVIPGTNNVSNISITLRRVSPQ